MHVPFNKPHNAGKELAYIQDAMFGGKLSGDGAYTKRCHALLSELGYNHPLLTTSCTDALEMAALMLDLEAGDEVIVPSFTFVSSASAFAMRGAKIIFADSCDDNPNIAPSEVARLISPRTKAVVVVHYAGVACDMAAIEALLDGTDIALIEDAAQAIDARYNGVPLGTIGRFGCLSFHDTKNVSAGEGGAIIVNYKDDQMRAEIIREKGTNRSAFIRGEIDKYGWVDLGSSFLPSELNAAYLSAQLENVENIQKKRMAAWSAYSQAFSDSLSAIGVGLPSIPAYASNNAHMFYLVCRSAEERSALMTHLKEIGVQAASHYHSLEKSSYYAPRYKGPILGNSDKFTKCLVRLPLFADITDDQVAAVCNGVLSFYGLD